MKKHLLFIFIIFFGQFYIHAQINIGGEPLCFSNKSINKNIPIINLPKQNNTVLIADAELNNIKDQPWQFGKNIDVNINLKEKAVVDTLPNGKLYRLAIKSENAKTINLRFSNYKIPKDATLYIYNSDKSDIIGGFTNANMQVENIFATGLIKGNNIILEYYEPYEADFSGELIIDRITHGFRGINGFNKDFEDSGKCNINVACDDGTWQNEIRSVCMLVTGGNGFCTGVLVNNTQEDKIPYILTAAHCYIHPVDMVFMFNWESETCDSPTLTPAHNDLSGAEYLALNYDSDFCLFRMNDVPPDEYEVFYAGWDANDIASENSVGIHHPSADIKKISYDEHPSVSDLYFSNQGIADSHWRILWDRETTTEPGSSGSPLFNENHKIIGQLHGGYASCQYNDEFDWYGKFSYSWDHDNRPYRSLKSWLDPLNSGVKDIEGFDPVMPSVNIDAQLLRMTHPLNNYTEITNKTPSFLIKNRGNFALTSFRINCVINNEIPITKQWTGNLDKGEITEIKFEGIKLSSGENTIEAYIYNPNETVDQYQHNDTIKKVINIFENIFEDDFEEDNIWYLTGEFQINKPEALFSGIAFPDPSFATSGENILGADLTGLGIYPGDYESNIDIPEFAQSPVIDCTNYKHIHLSFNRWLGVDVGNADKASIEIYSDSTWKSIWNNYNIYYTILDSDWKELIFDISEIADRKKIMVRYTIGPTNKYLQLCGWNIDDFKISGIPVEIQNTEKNKKISIFPNPAGTYFYIEIDDDLQEDAIITVSDLYGKIIYCKIFKSSETKTIENDGLKKCIIKIETNTVASQMLIVKVTDNTKEYIGKVIVLQ